MARLLYKYTKTYSSAGALHAEIEAAGLTGLLGVTWHADKETDNLEIEFESTLSTADKTTLDTVVSDYV